MWWKASALVKKTRAHPYSSTCYKVLGRSTKRVVIQNSKHFYTFVTSWLRGSFWSVLLFSRPLTRLNHKPTGRHTSSSLALFHLCCCHGQVGPLRAFVSPNSSTTALLPLSVSVSSAAWCNLPPQPIGIISPASLYPGCKVSSLEPPSIGGDLGFLNWNRRRIKNHWPAPNPNNPTNHCSRPLPLKLHSNGLNGVFWGQTGGWGGGGWRVQLTIYDSTKGHLWIPALHFWTFSIATVNTAQLVQRFHEIYSSKFLPHKHEDKFSERCHIHQTGGKLFVCCNLQPTGRAR